MSNYWKPIQNNNGAPAFSSSNNPILDMFTKNLLEIPRDREQFGELVREIERAKNYDLELFIKLLKLHRLIKKGNGMKGYYYICMMVLKEDDENLYKKVLEWSWQYPKDILRLHKLSCMFRPSYPNSYMILKNDPLTYNSESKINSWVKIAISKKVYDVINKKVL